MIDKTPGSIYYTGRRRPDGETQVAKVTYHEEGKDRVALRLAPSLKLVNHSPTGFEWGYYGSGPAQLALAILLDATEDADLALSLYQGFKEDFVAKWGGPERRQGWLISRPDLMAWVEANRPAEVHRREVRYVPDPRD